MPNKFSSGKFAIAQCDRCNFRYKLKQLKKITIKNTQTNLLVCPTCWEAPHPQSFLGQRPVNDPQAVRDPRSDSGFFVGGVDVDGNTSEGSRIIQWGFLPVGGARDGGLTPNDLNLVINIGTVTVSVT